MSSEIVSMWKNTRYWQTLHWNPSVWLCRGKDSVTKNSLALGFKLITILLYEKLASYSKVKWSTRNFRWYRSRLYQHEILEHKQMRLWGSFYEETKIIILSGYWLILFTHKNNQKVNEFRAIRLFPGTHGVYRVISPESCCFYISKS